MTHIPTGDMMTAPSCISPAPTILVHRHTVQRTLFKFLLYQLMQHHLRLILRYLMTIFSLPHPTRHGYPLAYHPRKQLDRGSNERGLKSRKPDPRKEHLSL